MTTVTKKKVEEVVEALAQEGKAITVYAVHKHLGGRKETIKSFLDKIDLTKYQKPEETSDEYPWGLDKKQVAALYKVLRSNTMTYLRNPGSDANLAELTEIHMLFRQDYYEMQENMEKYGCKVPRDHVRLVPLNKHFDYEDGGRWYDPPRAWLTLILSESSDKERTDFDHAQSFEINVPQIQALVDDLLRDKKIPPKYEELARTISNWPTTL